MNPLEQAALWFDEYAEIHSAKGNAEKAATNTKRAQWLREQASASLKDQQEFRAFIRISSYPEGFIYDDIPFGDLEEWAADLCFRLKIGSEDANEFLYQSTEPEDDKK